MKKLWAVLLAVWVGSAVAEPRQLVVLVQSGHISKEVVRQFEQHANVSVALIEYADEQQRDIMLTTTADQMDLVELDGAALANYRALDLLQVVQPKDVLADPDGTPAKAGHAALKQPVVAAVEPVFGVPYISGAIGIAWREDMVVAPITTWSRVFEQDSDLAGFILMPDDPLKAVAVAHLFMGQPLQSISDYSLKLARDVLRTQAPSVFYHSIGLEPSEMMVTGEATVAITSSTDAELLKKKFGLPVRFSLPEEGCVRWPTYWSVLRSSKAADVAAHFVQFISQPEQMTANTTATGLTFSGTALDKTDRFAACQELPVLAPELVKSINFLFFNLRRIQ